MPATDSLLTNNQMFFIPINKIIESPPGIEWRLVSTASIFLLILVCLVQEKIKKEYWYARTD